MIAITYTATEASLTEFVPHGARRIASGSVAVTDYFGRVLRIVPAGPDADLTLEMAAKAEAACIVCDGLGHAFIIGWETFDNGDSRPITGGGPCPLEG